MLVFEQIHTPGIAQMSYLIGDDSTGEAAVIDPRVDVEIYLDLARQHRLAITHIFETHIHADFLSGARELRHRLTNARLCLSAEDHPEYGFDHQPVRDGDDFRFGKLLLKARHTPGHTPEHLSYLAYENGHTDPWAVFSGDTLFIGSVGRPDLLGDEQTRDLAARLHSTFTGFYADLGDEVQLFPGHASGSSCGPDLGERKSSTIGWEKRHNSYLAVQSPEQFVQSILNHAPPEPRHYRALKRLNAAGPEPLGRCPRVPPLTAKAFHLLLERKQGILLDTRDFLAFGGAHIPGALNIGARPEMSVWAGWMLKHDDPLLLVLEDDGELDDVVRLLWRTGFTRYAGYLVGGMNSWSRSGLRLQALPQISVHDLRQEADRFTILDVRSPSEWEAGHIPGARHAFAPSLQDTIAGLDRNQPIATYCDSGYRASIAASWLQREGFQHVHNIPGSWQAWTNAGFEIAR